MIPTMSTTVIRYNGVIVFKIVFRSISVKPIPASAAAVQLLMANCPHSLAASSSSSDMMPVPFTSTTAMIIHAYVGITGTNLCKIAPS